jgi:hypothetical protein
MPSNWSLTPLQAREFFGRPWSGDGEWIPRPWLGWLPGPRRFHFQSFTSWITDELWLVHDTTTWEDGLVERRDGTARLLAADRIRLTYDDMLGGTEIQLHADGFTFSPYRMLLANPMLPIPIQVRAHDSCRWDPSTNELHDTIELRLIALPLGRLHMRLQPDIANPDERPNV